MAKGSKNQTISSVSDIIGFLLGESRKPPEKRRPIKPNVGEIQSDSEYVNTLVEALALPGTLVGDKYLDTIQSIVDPSIKVGTYKDRLGQVKIKMSDLPEFYDNPDEFIDKLFEKNKAISNKLQRIQWAGERMRMVHGSAYAKREKLFDDYSPEMRDILIQAMGQTAGSSAQAYDQIWIRQASQEIYNKGRVHDRYEKLSNMLNVETDEVRKRQINAEMLSIKKSLDGGKGTKPIENFRVLLSKEFELKSQEILRGRDPKDLTNEEFEEFNKTIQAGGLLNLWDKYDGFRGSREFYRDDLNKMNNERRDLLRRKDAISSGKTIKLDNRLYDYSGLSSTERNRLLEEINESIRGNRKKISALRGDQIWKDLGQAEGTWYGIRATLGPEGLGAIINGNFYDPKKGYFGVPSFEETLSVDLGNKKNGQRKEWGDIKFVKASKSKYWVREKGKDGFKQLDRKLVNQYNNVMVNIYYYNPVTLMKTLVTGERFAWMADKQLEKIKGEFKEADLQFLADTEFLNFYKKFQASTAEEKGKLLLSNENYAKKIGEINNLLKQYPDLLDRIQTAQELLEKFEKLKRTAIIFSQPQRLLNMIEDLGGTATKRVREFISDNILKKIFKGDKAVESILNDWVDFGVGKTLVAGITAGIRTWIVNILRITSATVTGGIDLVVSAVVSEVLEKVTKTTIKVIIYSLTGVIGLFILIGSLFTYSSQAKTDGYSREIPGTVSENPNFVSYGSEMGIGDESGYDNPNSESLAEFVPGDLPDGMTCLFGSGPSLRCTQGPYSSCNEPGYNRPSHYNSPAIDVGIGGNFAAPQFCDVTKGNCKVVSVGQETCGDGYPAGGYVKFTAEYNGRVYEFFVLHVGIGVSSGEILGPGQAVATISDDPSWHNCSTGLHAHVTVKVNGSYVNPSDVLNQDFGCSISSCPVENVCYW